MSNKQTVDIGSATLAYRQWGVGNGPVVVFSHSLFFDSSMFKHQVAHFSRTHHVIAYDHRGHGESSAGADDRYDMETLAEDAIGLIEALDLPPVHFAGNSMGGFVALRLAARRPDLLRSAIAMGSSGDAEENPEGFAPLLAHLQVHGGAGVEDVLLGIMFGSGSLASAGFAGEKQLWRDRFGQLGPLIAKPAAGVGERAAINPELRGSALPVLALAGGEDPVYAPHLSQRIAEAGLNGEWSTIAGAGHSVALEQPELTNEAIAQFIQRVDQA